MITKSGRVEGNMPRWRIVSSRKVDVAPTKEEMERLLPKKWPTGWEEISRSSGKGFVDI